MPFALNQIGQISLAVDDVDAADRFYAETLGLRRLYRYGDIVFFDCAGVRLFVTRPEPRAPVANSALYFRVADLAIAYRELAARGVTFVDEPHLIAEMEDHDLWMAFFQDPAGNTHALMQEAPKGYKPG